MTAKVKNDPKTYRKRGIAAPKGEVMRREGASQIFFTAPIGPDFYIDLRPQQKPIKQVKP